MPVGDQKNMVYFHHFYSFVASISFQPSKLLEFTHPWNGCVHASRARAHWKSSWLRMKSQVNSCWCWWVWQDSGFKFLSSHSSLIEKMAGIQIIDTIKLLFMFIVFSLFTSSYHFRLVTVGVVWGVVDEKSRSPRMPMRTCWLWPWDSQRPSQW